MVLKCRQFWPPRDIWQCLQIVLFVSTGGGGRGWGESAIGISWLKVREAATHICQLIPWQTFAFKRALKVWLLYTTVSQPRHYWHFVLHNSLLVLGVVLSSPTQDWHLRLQMVMIYYRKYFVPLHHNLSFSVYWYFIFKRSLIRYWKPFCRMTSNITGVIFAWGLPWWLSDKESACSSGDLGLIPGLGRSSGEGKGNPLQYSCLEKSYGQRSLAGYSPWHQELDMTWWLNNSNKTFPYQWLDCYPRLDY